MLLNGSDKPQGAIADKATALLTDQNTKAAQGALMGAVMLYTASEREMPEWLKVSLFITGMASVAMNVSKLGAPSDKGTP